MSTRPHYFERIREGASRRWSQLEQDPELAGPWHQLFKQVQSPRHILSELLQNADDAGATEAFVRIEDNVFIFEHNGQDFTEEHFASICRFGYSNKRSLHTIGFRGIGFKSTFSLGDQVELFTPTLSVTFNQQRFTEPYWQETGVRQDGKTCVRVTICDHHRQREVEKNLEEWLKSPISLLFFKHIRYMRIGNTEVHWDKLCDGPVQDSLWMVLKERPDERYLLIRSDSESFPEESLNEIRQERMLGKNEESDFPPCKIEIVLGVKGRLFVVLPTGVDTTLPFACNAPFIQDPARLKIKDPETSPTNRWLLKRAGKLAASAMLSWIQQADMEEFDRASAYGLFPDVDLTDNSLEGLCATIVKKSFKQRITDQPFLLTNCGELSLEKQSVVLPETIYNVWPPEQATELFDGKRRPPLSRKIIAADRQKLLNWHVIEEISKEVILRVIQNNHLPQPQKWLQLLFLWEYIAPDIAGYKPKLEPNSLRIIPVQGQETLYSAAEVVRLGEKKLLHSDDDWNFLAEYLIVLNQNWPRFLAEQRREAEEASNTRYQQAINSTYGVLKKIGLDDTSDVSKVIDRVALGIFGGQIASNTKYVQIAQIAAKLGATISDRFQYITQDDGRRPIAHKIFFDSDGSLEELVPEQDRFTHLLHHDYTKEFTSCSHDEWLKWVISGRSGLSLFLPFIDNQNTFYGTDAAEKTLISRGVLDVMSFPYSSRQFSIKDWDFADHCWIHWEGLSVEDERVWGRIAERIIDQPKSYWVKACNAELTQTAKNGWLRSVSKALLPSWVIRLRNVRCLPDTRGFYHKPEDLLRRTPENEALMDVELFVHSRFDREATQPILDLLGVRSTATGPDKLLDCLRVLSKAEYPPAHEVEKWYRRLDQLVDTCKTADFEKIRHAFRAEKLILTSDGTWSTSASVFIAADNEDVPGADVIRPSVGYLTLWRKIGVAERPTADLAIQWLKELPSGNQLSQDDARRVRTMLIRHPVRIWEECGHWLNLAGEWVPVDSLTYALTMQSLVAWGHLHEWVKQKTANLRSLSSETTNSHPFSVLQQLSSMIEDRLHRDPTISGILERKEWLSILGDELSRIELDDETETNRVRTTAHDLANTDWQSAPGLEIIPFIDGTPAGTARRADVVWLGRRLYVDGLSKAKLAKRVPEEINKQFNQTAIKAALDYSFERTPEDIRAYLEENFKLSPRLEMTIPGMESGNDNAVGEKSNPTPHFSEGMEASPEDETPEELNDPKKSDSDPDQEEADNNDDEPGEAKPKEVKDPSRPSKPDSKPPKVSIIERFAQLNGFRKESDDRFFHADGSWLAKTANGNRFPWEMRNGSGKLISYYLPKDHCLEQQSLQLEADVWGLIDSSPDIYTLILTDSSGKPAAMQGSKLRLLKEEGKLKLFPATYRLVMNTEP